jgi:teichuronic acid exporter
MTASTPPAPGTVAATGQLDRSLLRGLAWTGIAKWTTQMLRWVATFAIARLLTPADYGLVGMAMVYVGFVQLFNEFGLSSAIVQNQSLTRSDIARLSGFALGLGVLLFGVSVAVAGPIANFYDEPAVRWIVIVLSTKFVIDAIAMAPKAMLARALRFKRLAFIEGVEAVVMMAVTLSAAIVWRTHWALVAGLVASAFVAAAVAVVSSPVAPVISRDLGPLRGSVRFGRDVVVSTLAWYTYSNADFMIVGRVLSKAALGAYTLAWNIASVPVEKVSVMVTRVAPPIFAAVQHDTAALRRYFLALTEGLAFITFPLSIGLALVSEEFVLTALGDRWVDAILPMRLLAFYAGFRSIVSLPPLVVVARGHTRQARNFSLAAAIIMPVAFLIGSRWGTAGVATAWILAFPLCVIPLDYRYTFRLLEMGPWAFIRVLLPSLGGTAVMSAAVLLLRAALPESLPVAIRLVALVSVGALAYAGYMIAVHKARLRSYWETVNAARRGEALAPPT